MVVTFVFRMVFNSSTGISALMSVNKCWEVWAPSILFKIDSSICGARVAEFAEIYAGSLFQTLVRTASVNRHVNVGHVGKKTLVLLCETK